MLPSSLRGMAADGDLMPSDDVMIITSNLPCQGRCEGDDGRFGAQNPHMVIKASPELKVYYIRGNSLLGRKMQ
jgi:hypothetical protein